MKPLHTLSLLAALFLPAVSGASEHELECTVLDEGDRIIRCTFHAARLEENRTVVFLWRSESTPHDDRERTLVIPSRHASVYDYRYYYGRAPGNWKVIVNDLEGNDLASTSFTLP